MVSIGRAALSVGLMCGLVSAGAAAQDDTFTDKYCISPPHDVLCPTLPFDQTDFDSSFVYMTVEKGAQDPFDVFSWQAFIALNWPADRLGEPIEIPLGQAPGAPRVWQGFHRRDGVFGLDEAKATCADHVGPEDLLINELKQSDDTTLVDQDLNYVVYDTRLNDAAAIYVRDNALQTLNGQEALGSQNAVSFPQGRLPDPARGLAGVRPSVLLKTSWRILSAGAGEDRFLTRNGVIHVPRERSSSGQEMCLTARLGLVGMHIVMRTQSGNGDEWIWATFEHVDNAPVASNARNINSIFAATLFPAGCKSPETSEARTFSFFDPDCRDCATNAALQGDWAWSATPPFARLSGRQVARGTQVVRCWDIFESTAAINRSWQEKLGGTLWANYMLISTQWRGADKSPLFEHGEVPRYLTNTTMETYLQYDDGGTCLGCHAEAATKNGQLSNFTFILRHAE